MKESVSYTFLLDIIIVFIAISFFAIISIMSYSKAYRVNSKIVNAIEINEGYNKYAKEKIEEIITSYGYQRISKKCPIKDGQSAINTNNNTTSDGVCIYMFDDKNSNGTYRYGVITYMSYDFPIIGSLIRIPVYTKTMTMHYME